MSTRWSTWSASATSSEKPATAESQTVQRRLRGAFVFSVIHPRPRAFRRVENREAFSTPAIAPPLAGGQGCAEGLTTEQLSQSVAHIGRRFRQAETLQQPCIVRPRMANVTAARRLVADGR